MDNLNNQNLKYNDVILEDEHANIAFIAGEAYFRSGPLPSPKDFKEYEAAKPGAAERILVMAEVQAQHRRDVEMREVKDISRDSLLGLVMAFIIAILTITFGAYLVHEGQSIAGTVFAGIGLSIVVKAFIDGSRN